MLDQPGLISGEGETRTPLLGYQDRHSELLDETLPIQLDACVDAILNQGR
jgi:hypothetical protein